MTGPVLTLLTEPCDACPWVGKFPYLQSGRLKNLREECLKEDSPFVCHKTVGPDGECSPVWDEGVAVCAGWLRLGDPITVVQVAERMNYVERVPPP